MQVIDIITSGIRPVMSTQEIKKMEEDINAINDLRIETSDCPPLDLSKTFDEHFLPQEDHKESIKINLSRNGLGSDDTSDEDKDSSSNSDSDIDMSNNSSHSYTIRTILIYPRQAQLVHQDLQELLNKI